MLVKTFMSHSPKTFRQDDIYSKAFELMRKENLHHIPVLDTEDKIVGILAKRDLQLAAQHYKEAPVEVSEIMHAPVETIQAEETIANAARKMINHRLGALPVVDDDGHLVGIITEVDMLSILANIYEKD